MRRKHARSPLPQLWPLAAAAHRSLQVRLHSTSQFARSPCMVCGLRLVVMAVALPDVTAGTRAMQVCGSVAAEQRACRCRRFSRRQQRRVGSNGPRSAPDGGSGGGSAAGGASAARRRKRHRQDRHCAAPGFPGTFASEPCYSTLPTHQRIDHALTACVSPALFRLRMRTIRADLRTLCRCAWLLIVSICTAGRPPARGHQPVKPERCQRPAGRIQACAGLRGARPACSAI
jgi:hypothetical protein